MGPRRVTADELVFASDLAVARGILEAYEPRGTAEHVAAQRETRARMLAFIDAHPLDAHRRTQLAGHLTASALVIDAERGRALLTFHRKLGRWLQLGGHCDGDANLVGVALREAREESGIEELAIDVTPIDLDIHVIPARRASPPQRDEPEHLHLDTRFVVHARAGARETINDESLALRWFAPDELDSIETDESVRRLFALAFGPR